MGSNVFRFDLGKRLWWKAMETGYQCLKLHANNNINNMLTIALLLSEADRMLDAQPEKYL